LGNGFLDNTVAVFFPAHILRLLAGLLKRQNPDLESTYGLDHNGLHPMFLLDLGSYASGSITTGVVVDGNATPCLCEFQADEFTQASGTFISASLCIQGTWRKIRIKTSLSLESFNVVHNFGIRDGSLPTLASQVIPYMICNRITRTYRDPPVTSTLRPCSA